MRKLATAGGQSSPASKGALSARASQGLARPDSRRRPRRSPRPWRASAHRGRCRAALSSRVHATTATSVLPERLRPRQGRYPSIGPPTVLALGAVRQFRCVDFGDADPLAAAADRVAIVNRRRHAKRGGSKEDRHEAEPSALARPRQPASPLPPLAPIVTREGRHSCRRVWVGGGATAPTRALASRAGRRGARVGRGRRGAHSPLHLATSRQNRYECASMRPARPRCRRQSCRRERIPAHG